MTHRRFRPSKRFWLPAAVGCARVGAFVVRAQNPPPSAEQPAIALSASLQKRVQHELHQCRDAVVRIEATDEHGLLSGTGFFVDPNGLLYTTYSVAGKTSGIVVVRREEKYPARLLVADEKSGIALLQVDVQTAFLPVAKAPHDLGVGSPVMACGYPLDLALTPSLGLVGGFERKYLERYFATTHIRANVAVRRGEGGAPLLKMGGGGGGILISSMDQGAASLALPIEAAGKVRRDYVRYGRVRPGWLGVQLNAVEEPIHGSTAVVQGLLAGGAAQKGGIKVGDVFLGIGQSKITCPEDMLDATFFLTAEDPVPVRVARGEEELTLQVCPADLPHPQPDPSLLRPVEQLEENHFLRLRGQP